LRSVRNRQVEDRCIQAQVESLHRTLNSILAKAVDKTGILDSVMLWPRITPVDTTQPDILRITSCSDGKPGCLSISSMKLTARTKNLHTMVRQCTKGTNAVDAYADARVSLKKAAETKNRYYDLRVKPTAFAKGSCMYYFGNTSIRDDTSNTSGSGSTWVPIW